MGLAEPVMRAAMRAEIDRLRHELANAQAAAHGWQELHGREKARADRYELYGVDPKSKSIHATSGEAWVGAALTADREGEAR